MNVKFKGDAVEAKERRKAKHSDGNTEHIPHRFHSNSALYSQILGRFILTLKHFQRVWEAWQTSTHILEVQLSLFFLYKSSTLCTPLLSGLGFYVIYLSTCTVCSALIVTEHFHPCTLWPQRLLTLSLSLFTVNGSDVYMNSCLYGNGTSFVESLFEDFGEWTFKAPLKLSILFISNHMP